MNPKYVDTLRDAAVSLEKKSTQLSMDLMTLALEYRPDGPFIKNKVNEWSPYYMASKNHEDSLFKALNLVDEIFIIRLLEVCLHIEPNSSKFLSIKKKLSFSISFNSKLTNSFKPCNNGDFIPLGSRCTSAIVCRFASLHEESLPFDWTIPLTPDKTLKILKNNFDEFIPENIIQGESVRNDFYGINLAHFRSHKSVSEGVEKYKLRINRFKNMMNNSRHKYFIYVNEDFLYNPLYRDCQFNSKKFDDILILENYLKERYPHLSFNILYFDFVKHEVDSRSFVIPFHVETEKLWDIATASNFSQFRLYIGRVLSNIFSSTFNANLVVDDELFSL